MPREITVGDPQKHHVHFLSVDPPTRQELEEMRQTLAHLDEHCTGKDCPHTVEAYLKRYKSIFPPPLHDKML